MSKENKEAIEREVQHWPGVEVTFEQGGKHPKSKFKFTNGDGGEVFKSLPFSGTPGDNRSIANNIAQVRRTLQQMGAARVKPQPASVEEEDFYRKPNDGAAKRPDPVAGEPAKLKPTMAEQLEPVKREAVQADGSAETYQTRGFVESVIEEARQHPEAAATSASALAMCAALAAFGMDIEPVGDIPLAAVIRTAAGMIKDGIYFGLPDEVYHEVPRLSSSGIQKIAVSPATFWTGSWLDPDRPERDSEQTDAQKTGKAYHCARLEPERFELAYCRQPGAGDFEGEVLTSDNAIKAALKDYGLPQTQSGESIAERGYRLIEAGYRGTVMACVMAEFEATRGDRIALKGETYDEIVRDMGRIHQNKDIGPLLTGGEAEVSIFWTDAHGLKMKCRVDYLTALWWVDFKTFDNSKRKELNQCLTDAVRYNRYYLQAGVYRDGIEALRTGGLQIIGAATGEQRELVAKLQIAPSPLRCWFVFQEKSGVPNLLAREFKFNRLDHIRQSEVDAYQPEDGGERARQALAQPTQLYQRAVWEIDRAKREFVLYSEVYPAGEPWAPIDPVGAFNDEDFNLYWLEGRS